MDLGLQGCVAIVGGASSGMGRACAVALAREGCNVAVFARRRELLDEAVAEIEALGSGAQALAVNGDSALPADLEALVERTLERFGRLDIVVNNTGGPPAGTFEDFDDDAWRRAWDLTLMSTLRLTRLSLPELRKSGRGRVVNIASHAVRQPVDGVALSNVVRSGVVAWAKTLSRELAPRGITVNSVAPGLIDTPRIRQLGHQDPSAVPVGRIGLPAEVGDVVCFLASDRASYITGALIPVDGGLSRPLL